MASKERCPIDSWVHEYGKVDLVHIMTKGSEDLNLHEVELLGRVHRVTKEKDQDRDLQKPQI